MQENLDELKQAVRLNVEYEGSKGYVVDAAESAVLALYEQQKAVADELAKALNGLVGFHVCDNCLWPGHSCSEKDCRGVAQEAADALFAYNKAAGRG
jgi:hypothetical protein